MLIRDRTLVIQAPIGLKPAALHNVVAMIVRGITHEVDAVEWAGQRFELQPVSTQEIRVTPRRELAQWAEGVNRG